MTDTIAHWIRGAGALGLGALLVLGGAQQSSAARPPLAQEAPKGPCLVDLSKPGQMSDIVSNALLRGLKLEEPKVRAFLRGADTAYASGDQLLSAAARHFGIDEAALRVQVNGFQHVNCQHGPVGGADNGIRDNWFEHSSAPSGAEAVSVEDLSFARDVILHVVLHELGHALVREFDLPILGNEETLADAFATHYLTTYLPERAEAALRARVESLMIEAREVPRIEWTVAGEHDCDARRAYQIAALSVAADRTKYAAVAEVVGMSADDVRRASDYGAEVHRSWRRILAPLRMPEGTRSNEVSLSADGTALFESLLGDGLAEDLRGVLGGFDWHSQVTLAFKQGDGGAAWSRSQRTIRVNEGYVRRFIEQGQSARRASPDSAR